MHPVRPQFDEKQDVARLQGDRFHSEASAGEQLCPVTVQKGPPETALSLRGRRQMMPAHDVAHGAWIQAIAQFEQLAVILAMPHPGILVREPYYQRFQFGIESRVSPFVRLAKGPFTAYQVAM